MLQTHFSHTWNDELEDCLHIHYCSYAVHIYIGIERLWADERCGGPSDGELARIRCSSEAKDVVCTV